MSNNNILIIVNDNKVMEAISDVPINVFTRNYSNGMAQAIPTRIDTLVSIHDLSAEISGVQVTTYDPAVVITWPLHNKTVKEAMAENALSQAETMGLVNNINRDHAFIMVDFRDDKFHCYLMFEEDV